MRHAPAAILLALAVGTPAAAQIFGPPRTFPQRTPPVTSYDTRSPGPSVSRDLARTRDRIEDAREAGALTRSEARGLKREARRIDRLDGRLSGNGLSDSGRRELDTRAALLRDSLDRALIIDAPPPTARPR